jgi:multiple sugar transport system substrate-binding protein
MKRQLPASKLVLALLAGLIISVLFVGCSFGSEPAHTVTFWSSDTATADMQSYQRIIDAFEKINPAIHVNLVGQPAQSQGDNSSIVTAVRGGQPPDVYLTDRFTVNQQAATGLLTNISSYIQKDDPTLANNYLPYAWNEVKYEGGVYGMPMDTDARALFYNKDMLKQAGIDPSILDASHGPIMLDQLEQIASKLTKTDARGNYTQLGLVPWADEGYALTWALDYGANFFNNSTCQFTATEPAMIKALTFLQDWAKKLGYQKVNTFEATYQPPNAPPSESPFFTGHVAMEINGTWNVSSLKTYAPKINYGVTYIPVTTPGQQPFTWSGGFGLVMPTGAQNPTDAYRFMKFMTGSQGQSIYTKDTGHLSTWASLNSDSQLISGGMKFFVDLLAHSESRAPLPAGAQLWAALLTAQQGVTISDESPLSAAQQVQQQVQPDMQQYCPYQLEWERPTR